jgi:hypothetical protein
MPNHGPNDQPSSPQASHRHATCKHTHTHTHTVQSPDAVHGFHVATATSPASPTSTTSTCTCTCPCPCPCPCISFLSASNVRKHIPSASPEYGAKAQQTVRLAFRALLHVHINSSMQTHLLPDSVLQGGGRRDKHPITYLLRAGPRAAVAPPLLAARHRPPVVALFVNIEPAKAAAVHKVACEGAGNAGCLLHS